MAGEWLKFDCSLPEKPEVLAITVALGWDDPDLTVGKLMRLFRWFDQHTVDGNARGVTPALLDRIVGVTGFVTALADAGWIAVDRAGVSLKNFDRHNGATAKGRALTAKRVANHKANAKGNGEGNAASVTSALPREEKRRKEKKERETRFAEFWEAWPLNDRKQDKGKCQAKWQTENLDSIAEQVLADVELKKTSRKWTDDGGKFIEAPLVYLNNRRWEDGAGQSQTTNPLLAGAI